MAITWWLWWEAAFSLSQRPCCRWERISGICCTMAHRNYYFHPVRPPTTPSGQWCCMTAKSQTSAARGLREKQACLVSLSNCRDLHASYFLLACGCLQYVGWKDSLSFGKVKSWPTNKYLFPWQLVFQVLPCSAHTSGPTMNPSLGKSC